MKPRALFLAAALAVGLTAGLTAGLAAGPAAAQQRDRGAARPPQGMSKDERQRMRNDMRDVYTDRNRERSARPERPRQMTPQEREKLRRDIEDANRDLRR